MANKLKVQEQEAITNLIRLGWGIRKIARELHLSRNTVRTYVRAVKLSQTDVVAEEIKGSTSSSGIQTDPLSTPGSTTTQNQTDPLSTSGNTGRKSLCDDHAALILAKFESGLTAQRIYQDLRFEIAFTGSYQSVKRYVRRLRRTDPQLVYRIEVEPGEEVQVDFGSGPTLLQSDGKKRKSWIFRLVLSYSRKAYSQAVLRQDTETFLRCIEAAFREFGGSSLTINLDNLKAAVLKANWADPELNPKLIDFARHYSTTIMPCLPGVPEHKEWVSYCTSCGLLEIIRHRIVIVTSPTDFCNHGG